jgi:hypothetical protein
VNTAKRKNNALCLTVRSSGARTRQIDTVRDHSDWISKTKYADLLIFLLACRVQTCCAADHRTLERVPEHSLFPPREGERCRAKHAPRRDHERPFPARCNAACLHVRHQPEPVIMYYICARRGRTQRPHETP